MPNDFIIFTFGSPSDDSQPTSDGKREHPLLSSCRSAAFPHRVHLRDGEGEMLGSQTPLPKHDPRWHVHFLTRDEKTTPYVLLLTLSPSRRPCCLLLALVFTCSPPTLENIQSSQVSLSKKRRKQVQALFIYFFLREEGFRSNTEPPCPPPYKKTIVNSIPWGLRRQKLTGGKKCSVFASLAWSVLQEQMAAGSGLWGTACLPECNGNILCRELSLNIAKQYAMRAPIQGGSF